MEEEIRTSNKRSASPPAAPPDKKTPKLARSKAACQNCHRAKQRCEGPSVCPCHRCATFGIECVFPGSGTASSSSLVAPSKAASVSAARAGSVANGKGKAVARPSGSSRDSTPSASPGTATNNPDLAEQLRIMTARLESIESTLARAQVTFPNAADPSHRSTSDHSPHPANHSSEFPRPAEYRSSNPVETAGEAIAVEGLVDLSGPARSEPDWAATVKPDVIDRGLLTVAEVANEFKVFYEHIHPWVGVLSLQTDQDSLAVRDRSPILFHAILLLTAYYHPRTPSAVLLYRAIGSILDSILTPMILCAQPDELNADLVCALYLLLLYKPVQYASLSARGITDPTAAEHASKMNIRASWLLRTLCLRVSAYINLPSCTTTFAQAFAKMHVEPIPEQIVQDQRLYFSSLWHSLHGGLQSGSRVDFIPEEALKTTRLFATLCRQPSDLRLAASVELASTAAALLHTRKENDKVERIDLLRFNQAMDDWHEHWVPLLQAQSSEDELSYSTQFPYASFTRVVINGFPYTAWKADKKEYVRNTVMLSGSGTAPTLTADDLSSIKIAVSAAEGMMLALTVEGRAEVALTGKQMASWSGRETTLTLDERVITRLRWASDSLTCVVYSYALIFLAKLANDGILHADLNLIPASSIPTALSPLDPNDKLCRLLQLGADFLDLLAPNPNHPAVRQAAFLRRIRDAGISGRRGVISAPGSPGPNPTTTFSSFPPASTTTLISSETNHLSNLHHSALNPHSAPFSGYISPSRFQPSPSPAAMLVEDPFSALLNGVSPSVFDSQGFFGMELGGLRWDLDDDLNDYSHF